MEGLLFSLYALVSLGSVRYRAKSPCQLSNHLIFGSKHFCDKTILKQLCDENYQTRLSDHNWPELEKKGPCYFTLAQEMLENGRTLEEALALQKAKMNAKVYEVLTARMDVLRAAMREIAESYLARSLKTDQEKFSKEVPEIVLNGSKGKQYRPVKFIARGSAGAVYTAVRVESESSKLASLVGKQSSSKVKSKFVLAAKKQIQRQLALKRIQPTQKSSAENEYRIASLLDEQEQDYCVSYLDRADESPEHLWLLLRRISPSPYGIDLSEYIQSQFFETGSLRYYMYAQAIVMKLLLGLDYIASCGVCMRDVKSDNVLVEYDQDLEGTESLNARWSDFGLSVDLGKNFDAKGIRSPSENQNSDQLLESLVGFWYDTQKLVPKPTWKGRRPPERCYQNPLKVHISSYDLYMVGIIIVSMALGVDIPHINKSKSKKAFENAVGMKFDAEYLETFELGAFVAQNPEKFRHHFHVSFGHDFGNALLKETIHILSTDPRERPRPKESHDRLLQFQISNLEL